MANKIQKAMAKKMGVSLPKKKRKKKDSTLDIVLREESEENVTEWMSYLLLTW